MVGTPGYMRWSWHHTIQSEQGKIQPFLRLGVPSRKPPAGEDVDDNVDPLVLPTFRTPQGYVGTFSEVICEDGTVAPV